MAHHIVISTVEPEEYLAAWLFPNSEEAVIRRAMSLPGHYTHLFSLSGLGSNTPLFKINPCLPMLGLSRHPPSDRIEWFLQLFRTRWLGRSEDSINDDIALITQMIEQAKRESINPSFPKQLNHAQP